MGIAKGSITRFPRRAMIGSSHAKNRTPSARKSQIRSTLTTIVKTMEAEHGRFKQPHVAAMMKTPFYALLRSVYRRKITTASCRKRHESIISVLEQFNASTGLVRLGSEELEFRRSDVKLIFGIVDGPDPIRLSTGRPVSAFADRVFGDVKLLNLKLVKQKLHEVLQRTEQIDIEDAIRLLILILIGSLFFSSSGLTICWGWIPIVEDLNNMRSYDWSGKILSTLINSMKRKKKSPSRITGCTLFLLYWLTEHAKIVKPAIPDGVPRVVKWYMPRVCARVDRGTLQHLTGDMVHKEELTETTKEVRVYMEISGRRDIEAVGEAANQSCISNTSTEIGAEFPPSRKSTELPAEDTVRQTKKVNDEELSLTNEPERVRSTPDSSLWTCGNSEIHQSPFSASAKTASILNNIPIDADLPYVCTPRGKILYLGSNDCENSGSKNQNSMETMDVEQKSFPVKFNLEVTETYQTNRSLKTPTINFQKSVLNPICIPSNSNVAPTTSRVIAKTYPTATLVARIEQADIANHHLTARVQDLEQLNCSKEMELGRIRDILAAMNSENQNGKSKVSELEDVIKELIVRIKLLSDKVNKKRKRIRELKDIMINDEITIVRQDSSKKGQKKGSKGKKSPSSMVKRLKQKKRRAVPLDNNYVYNIPTRAAGKPKSRGTKSNSLSIPPCQKDQSKTGEEQVLHELDEKEDASCIYMLGDDCLQKLIETTRKGNGTTVYYNTDPFCVVTLRDIMNILNEAYIDNVVIDAYGIELLKSTYTDGKSVIMNSSSWSTLRGSPVEHTFYDEVSAAETNQKRQILFPICSNGQEKDAEPMHWTLMVYDVQQGSYQFYNSLKPKGENAVDHFLADSKIIRAAVERSLAKPSFHLWTPTPPMPTISAPDLPQQGETNDCAIFVCYYMKQVVLQRPIKPHLTREEVEQMKTEIIETIMLKKPVI